jgi:hypothetical protein
MSVNANKARLVALTRTLSLQWEETKNHWRDEKSQEFGRQYMEQLLLQVDKAVTVCDKLEQIINQARSDCE